MSRRDPLRFEVQNEYLGHQLMSIFNLCCVICLAYFWATPLKKSYNQHRQRIKKQRHYFANKGPSSQGYGFSSSHVWMRELDCEEGWVPKDWCFWPVVLEKTLESPLDCRETQPVHSKGDQSWIFIGRTLVEAETPILWPPDAKSWLIGKDPDAGKDWGQEEKGMTEDEIVWWHHQLDGHGFGWTLGIADGQRGLACCGFMELQRIGYDWATELNRGYQVWNDAYFLPLLFRDFFRPQKIGGTGNGGTWVFSPVLRAWGILLLH